MIEQINNCFFKTIDSDKLKIGSINNKTLILFQEYLRLRDINIIFDLIRKNANNPIEKITIVA